MIYDIFPEKLPEAESGICWDCSPLPNLVWWDGQQVAEEISGLIYKFLGEENFDNLSACVQYRDYFSKNLRESVVTFEERTNEDVIQGLGRMAATLQGMDEHV